MSVDCGAVSLMVMTLLATGAGCLTSVYDNVTLLLLRSSGAFIMIVTFWDGAAALSWTGAPPLNRI